MTDAEKIIRKLVEETNHILESFEIDVDSESSPDARCRARDVVRKVSFSINARDKDILSLDAVDSAVTSGQWSYAINKLRDEGLIFHEDPFDAAYVDKLLGQRWKEPLSPFYITGGWRGLYWTGQLPAKIREWNEQIGAIVKNEKADVEKLKEALLLRKQGISEAFAALGVETSHVTLDCNFWEGLADEKKIEELSKASCRATFSGAALERLLRLAMAGHRNGAR